MTTTPMMHIGVRLDILIAASGTPFLIKEQYAIPIVPSMNSTIVRIISRRALIMFLLNLISANTNATIDNAAIIALTTILLIGTHRCLYFHQSHSMKTNRAFVKRPIASVKKHTFLYFVHRANILSMFSFIISYTKDIFCAIN